MPSIREYLVGILESTLDFIFPPFCVLCGKLADIESVICKLCADNLQSHPNIVTDISEALEFVFVLAPFDEPHRMLIHIFKYDGVVSAGRFLGRKLGEAVERNYVFKKFNLLVPVPLHRKRHQKRGYNQAEIIAKYISEVSGIPYSVDVVSRIRATQSQTKLSRSERVQNVAGAFEVVKPDAVAGKCIAIVDDVVTTGATTSEIARTLLSANASGVCAICISRPNHRDSKEWNI